MLREVLYERVKVVIFRNYHGREFAVDTGNSIQDSKMSLKGKSCNLIFISRINILFVNTSVNF